MGLDVDAVYRDAWQIYRLLFRRSVLTAAIVFAFVLAFDQVGAHLNDNGAVAPFIGMLSFVDAHVLTVLFYRLTDSEHPVVHDDVFSWPSIWQSA